MAGSLIAEHGADVVHILIVMLGTMGAIVITLIGWSIKQVLKRLVGIEDAILNTNATITIIRDDIGEDISLLKTHLADLQGRIAAAETSIRIYHGSDRRSSGLTTEQE